MEHPAQRFRLTHWMLLALLPCGAFSCSHSDEPFWTKKKKDIAVATDMPEPVTPPETPETPATPDPVEPPPVEKPIDPPPAPAKHDTHGKKPSFVDIGSNLNKNAGETPAVEVQPDFPTDPLLKDATEICPVGGRFRIWVPEAYTNDDDVQQKDQTLDGGIKLVISTSTSDKGRCMAAFNDYPESHVKKVGEESIRNEIIDEFVKSLNGRITRTENIKLAGKNATSIRFTGKKQVALYGRLMVLLDGSRVYQIAFISDKPEEPAQARVDAFFKSFQFIKK